MFLFIAYIPNYFNLAFPEIMYFLSEGRSNIVDKRIRYAVIYPSLIIPFSWIALLIYLLLLRYCSDFIDELTEELPIITEEELKESLY